MISDRPAPLPDRRSGAGRGGSSLRRLRLGLRTLLGGKPGGFFIPYRHAAAVAPTDYPALAPLFAAALPEMREVLALADRMGDRLAALAGPPPVPRWDQSWFPRLDGIALYTMVRAGRPARILEIGSGHSTRFMAQAIRDGGFDCAMICIDPQPRADVGQLPLELHRRLLRPEDLALARELAAGDLLFIDSSHVAMPGSDVDLLLNGFLPALRPGVLVHLHDIFLPDAYPPAWAWRGYNEQLAVGCLLQGGGYAVRFASHYLATRWPALIEDSVAARIPLPAEALEGSLWLQKLGEAAAG
ncbi:MAG: class I SAM-dependent methyltransferase [Geminicoccaceae bacterium]